MKTPVELSLSDEEAAIFMAGLRALGQTGKHLTIEQRLNIAILQLKLDSAIVAASKKETQALLARFEAATTDEERLAIMNEFQISL